ncbi:glycosyltransferase [Glaciihabitans sp. dw_435]|uniref:glycosyltransferase n=1 Tax=Glaciihabitans sp. dw_435 TaxID=2720081 RepID=UPI001BD6327C|nr:glycosyltransferase [Glaciihabitans sp. dw_435]
MISSATLATRLGQVAAALDIPGAGDSTPLSLEAATALLVRANPAASDAATYLLLSVTAGAIPTPAEIVRQRRLWQLNGLPATIADALARARKLNRWARTAPPAVLIAGGTVVDVHDTASTPFTTGIQRVVRSTLQLWAERHELLLVGWDDVFGAPRTLTPAQHALALGRPAGSAPEGAHAAGEPSGTAPSPASPTTPQIVIPFRATLVLPEIAVDDRRSTRLQAIALHSGSRAVAIGYDCIPITTAETAGAGMPGGFARYLSALSAFDVVAPISQASGTEFSGWKRMLAGSGVTGPRVDVVDLPGIPSGHIVATGEAELRATLELAPDETVLLAVGSHEPRKNHLALLQAAEIAWEGGATFTLVMVGGNSWDTASFDRALASARARGRRILTLTAASDETVWGLYSLARFSLFPSLNEGFGLPVVESLSFGTPVITSDFGSMRELAAGHGGVLVDPRDERSIAEAMNTLLRDDSRLAELVAETSTLPQRHWSDYADDLWSTLQRETS